MKTTGRASAHVAALTLLMMLSACGGGGDSSPAPAPPPPPVNGAPTLTTTAITTDEDVNSSTQVAASDPDGNPLTFALATNPQHGTATLTATGALTYAPAANYFGPDSLGITVSDNAGAQVTGTINITVTGVNDAPVLTSTNLAVDEDGRLTTQLAGTDAEGDVFTFQFPLGANHGTLAVTTSGAITYTPDVNYWGADQVRLRLVESVSGLTSAEQLLSIQVRSVNDPPLAQDDSLRVPTTPGQAVVVPALANDSDFDGDVITPTVVSQPRGGTVTVNPSTRHLTFEPANAYVGPIEFTYRVSDGHVDSGVVSVRAVIGEFLPITFLSDYTTPGRAEVHIFDGLEVRRVSDAAPTGYNIVDFSVSGDLRTLAYSADGANDIRAYVQPMDGSSAAVLRYSVNKTSATQIWLGAYLNTDGSHLLVYDYLTSQAKPHFVVNVATGATTQLGANMPGIIATRYANFHPWDPRLIVLQGQTAGPFQPDIITQPMAKEMFVVDAASPGTFTQIGHSHSLNEYGGEGYNFSRDPRVIYYGDYRTYSSPTFSVTYNLVAYDRVTGAETPVVRFANPPDRGINGSGWMSPDSSRMCFGVYEPTTSAYDGPSRFYAMELADPTSARPVSPVLDDISQCAMASDNRTVIYRVYALNRNTQHAYAVDSVNPGTPVLLAPDGEAGSKQGTWQVSPHAMRVAIAYFDNDGSPYTTNQVGRYYSLPLDGGSPFLFSDSYLNAAYSTWFYDSNDDGSFLIYGRPKNGIAALELMSTRGLNLSIPLSRTGETIGVTNASWLRPYP